MAPPKNSRRSQYPSLLLPLAGALTAAVASYALYYFTTQQRTTPQQRRTTRGLPSSPEIPSRHKPSIFIVVRESPALSALLQHIPTPLPLDRVNVFILLYSPDMASHPLSSSSDEDAGAHHRAGRVYRQALKMFPPDAPREMVMPFTDKRDIVPILKNMAPRTVYVEGALVGEEAEAVKGVIEGGWVGEVVVAVEEEETGRRVAERTRAYGKKCAVLDVGVVEDDWGSRVLG